MTKAQHNRYIELAREFSSSENFNEFMALYLFRYAELYKIENEDKLDFLLRELSEV